MTSHSTKSRDETAAEREGREEEGGDMNGGSGSLAHALRSLPLSFQLLSSRLLRTIFIARSSSDAGKLLAQRAQGVSSEIGDGLRESGVEP